MTKTIINSFSTFTQHIYKFCRKLNNRSYTSSINGCVDLQLKKLLNDFHDVKFSPFRVLKPHFGSSFTKAHMEVVQFLEDREGNIKHPEWVSREEIANDDVTTRYVCFQDMFKNGFDKLEEVADGRCTFDDSSLFQHESLGQSFIDAGENQTFFLAVDALRNSFINRKSFHEECLIDLRIPFDGKVSESKVTALLASHLFSPLVARFSEEKACVVTNDVNGKYSECPCPKACRQEIIYGKTDIGSEYLWYGRPDIMVFPVRGGACNIVIAKEGRNEAMREDCLDEIDKQMIEVKRFSSDLRNEYIVPQIVSQAIVFSFYQKKYQLKHRWHYPITTLIPSIAVCGSAFDVYFYDSENDILLRNLGGPIPMWDVSPSGKNETFNMSSMLLLWMVINHLSINPTLRQVEIAKLQKSCGLEQQMESQRLQKVEQTIQMNKHFVRPKNELPVTALPVTHTLETDKEILK